MNKRVGSDSPTAGGRGLDGSPYGARGLRNTIPVVCVVAITGMTLLAGCSEEKTSSPVGNSPPDTHLFLEFPPDSLPSPSPSKQVLHWWGDDPDGEVVGYWYMWDFYEDWQWTTLECDTFYVPIDSAMGYFTFSVKAVDDAGAEDPEPASLTFPIYNSPPTVAFRYGSNPVAIDTAWTFTTRTFSWDASDPDGDETVVEHMYRLDEGDWVSLPAESASVTLRELSPGEHWFYLFSRDIAGATSPVIQFPDSTVDSPDAWVVKEPVGDVLLIDDYELESGQQVLQFYASILDTLVGDYSTWRVDPPYGLPAAQTDVTETLKLFRILVWYSYFGTPHYAEAMPSINAFLMDGGSLLAVSTHTSSFRDSAFLYADIIDSILPERVERVGDGTAIEPLQAGYPALTTDVFFSPKVYLYVTRDPATHDLYRLEEGEFWAGTPTCALISEDRGFVLFSLPLHNCNRERGAEAFLAKLLLEEFD
jgi:hypothetical protein